MLICVGIIVLACVYFYILYEYTYYKSERFNTMKEKISSHVKECNDLNKHVTQLKKVYFGSNQLAKGNSLYTDNSFWNYKRPKLKEISYSKNIYNCSKTICDNSRKQPFKYICKYFNIKPDELTLNAVEKTLNNFAAVEDGQQVLLKERERIIYSVSNEIPWLIETFGKKKLYEKVGFFNIDLKTPFYPQYEFNYVSAGGYASMNNTIILDIPNLNEFVNYLSGVVKFKKSIQGQRALMTTTLRNQIKHRDNYTCQNCGATTKNEPNLLLEIDHIIPLSKGGTTTVDNLQTLCWRCNRSKGAKIVSSKIINENASNLGADNSNKSIAETKTEIIHKNNNTVMQSIELSSEKKNDILSDMKTNYELNDVEKKNLNPNNIEICSETLSKKETKMNDFEGNIFPSGQYLVGDDIPLGKYILKPKKNDRNSSIKVFMKESDLQDNNYVSHDYFEDDYYIAFRESKFIVVSNASIHKI